MSKRFNQNANDHRRMYQELGINLDTLGCVMLDVQPVDLFMTPLAKDEPQLVEEIKQSLYTSPNKDRFWINGWTIGKTPHLTLLYGLMESGQKWKKQIDHVLYGWHPGHLYVEFVGYFNSPYKEEPYWCIVARIKMTNDLQHGHDRLSFLPHINTFPAYKPHVTMCYIRKDKGVAFRNKVLRYFDKYWRGKTFAMAGVNYGD